MVGILEDGSLGGELKMQLVDNFVAGQSGNPVGVVLDTACLHLMSSPEDPTLTPSTSLFQHSASIHLAMASVAQLLSLKPPGS